MSSENKISKITIFLSQVFDSDIKVQAIKLLYGNVHQNLFIECKSNNKLLKLVVRIMPDYKNSGFERQILPYNLEKEYHILKDLEKVDFITPKVFGIDRSGEIFGSPSFIMEFIEGRTVLEAIRNDPEGILNNYVDTILLMNSISPFQLPSFNDKNNITGNKPVNLLGWLTEQSKTSEVPSFFQQGLEYLKDIPPNRPLPVFGNGDLNPQNFIHMNNGSIAVVDWEYAGFYDPLAELMLLHVYPEERPFLSEYPLDKIYCQKAGFDVSMLKWYELYGALNAWIFAFKNNEKVKMDKYEKYALNLTFSC